VQADEGEAAAFVARPHHKLVGHPAPVVSLELLDGKRIELVTVLGKRPIYRKFWRRGASRAAIKWLISRTIIVPTATASRCSR
jgi:hypothetical protein